MYSPPKIEDVVAALESLKNIPRPYGDNEDEAINSPEVYEKLSVENQELVDYAEEIVKDYLCKSGDHGDEPNERSIKKLNQKGFPTIFDADQYELYKLVGSVEVDDWKLDISDQNNECN